MSLFLLPARTEMSVQHCLEEKHRIHYENTKQTQILDYHENTGGPNGHQFRK